MIAYINNTTITVNVNITPVKSSGDKTVYDIYLIFSIYQDGIQTFPPITFSSGESLQVVDWDKPKKQMKGGSDHAKAINTRLRKYVSTAVSSLEGFFSRKDGVSCSEVFAYIKTTLKPLVIGKAPWGQKQEFQDKMVKNSVEAVMQSLLDHRRLCPERQRQYPHAVSLLHTYFNNNTPLITNISDKDLLDFKIWYRDNYRVTRGKRKGKEPLQNSTTTWFNMIGGLFVHAHRVMRIIPALPLPPNFRGSFTEADRIVLSECECLELIKLEDSKLSIALQRSKYCLLLQLLTGISYCDLKALKREHVKYDRTYEQWFIKKHREKNKRPETQDVPFTVFLTPRAQHCFDRLRDLAGGTDTIFKLPTIECTNGQYRKLAKMAGVSTKVTTYILRHTFAVDNMDNGTPIEDIQVMLGQKDLRTTQIYAKVSRKRLHGNIAQLTLKSKMHQL